MKIKEGGGVDLQKEREAFEAVTNIYHCIYNADLNYYFSGSQFVGNKAEIAVNAGWKAWQAAKAQAVPEVTQRQGGYYIRDLRSQPGNCMKFWYQAGYGTKHKNFFWCATLEEAKEYKGGCDWFEIWHAPYIDSLVEYTVDFQLADRGVGLVDLKAQEPAND